MLSDFYRMLSQERPLATAGCFPPVVAAFFVVTVLAGCGTCLVSHPSEQKFVSEQNGFAFANELHWEYGYDTNGVWRARKRQPAATYALHCFPMARAACCFFYHARFEPDWPALSDREYSQRIRQIISRGSKCPSPENQKIAIPGFKDLFEFSRAHETLLKARCGGAWRSYLQSGNWRMVFPMSRKHQEETARDLKTSLKNGMLPIIHVSDFPIQRINHFMLVTQTRETDGEMEFSCYDPNRPGADTLLRFDLSTKRFWMGPNSYFPGGPVKAYTSKKTARFRPELSFY